MNFQLVNLHINDSIEEILVPYSEQLPQCIIVEQQVFTLDDSNPSLAAYRPATVHWFPDLHVAKQTAQRFKAKIASLEP